MRDEKTTNPEGKITGNRCGWFFTRQSVIIGSIRRRKTVLAEVTFLLIVLPPLTVVFFSATHSDFERNSFF
jgi:hypothetical protein